MKRNSTYKRVSNSTSSLSTCSLSAEPCDATAAAGLEVDTVVAEDAVVAIVPNYTEHFDYEELDAMMIATYSK